MIKTKYKQRKAFISKIPRIKDFTSFNQSQFSFTLFDQWKMRKTWYPIFPNKVNLVPASYFRGQNIHMRFQKDFEPVMSGLNHTGGTKLGLNQKVSAA